ncbi:hypothetical protein GCM10020001_096150 [Nonomuraea salmonea]
MPSTTEPTVRGAHEAGQDAGAQGVGGGARDVGLQLVLVGEVVAQGPGGPAGLGGDAADGHAGQALAQDHPDGRRADLRPPLLMIDESGHSPMLTRPCYLN